MEGEREEAIKMRRGWHTVGMEWRHTQCWDSTPAVPVSKAMMYWNIIDNTIHA